MAHFVPDQHSFLNRRVRAQPHLIIFPRFQMGATLQCTPLPPSQTAMRIGTNSFNYQILGPVAFEAVVHLARHTPAYELVFGDLDEALAHIDVLFEGAP